MPISFVGSHVGTHAATTTQSIGFSNLRNEANVQPTLQAGDIVLVAVENSSTIDRTQAQLTPNGYTAAHTDNYQNDSNDSNFLVSYKIMGETPDTFVAIPASNSTAAGVAYAIYVFRGVNPTTPLDVTPVVTGGINTGVANAPAITPITPGAWIVAFAGAAVSTGAVFTNPTGMSATTNHFRSAVINTTTTDAVIGGAIFTGWSSGAYDPAAFGGSTTSNTGSWSAVTLALEPIVDAVTLTPSLFVEATETFGAATVTAANPEPYVAIDYWQFGYAEWDIAAAQSLSPSLFANSNAFYAPTITRGAVTLSPANYTDPDTFSAATVSRGPVALIPALYADTDAFHGATVASVYSLAPVLYADGDSFLAATVTAIGGGTQTLSPSLLTDADAFYSATVARGTVALSPSLYADGDTFLAATVTLGAVGLSPALLSDGDTFHAPTITRGAVVLLPARLTDGDAFYSATVSGGGLVLSPLALSDADVFHSATVNRGLVALSPSLLTDGDTFYGVTVGSGGNRLSPELLDDGDTFYSPAVDAGSVILPLRGRRRGKRVRFEDELPQPIKVTAPEPLPSLDAARAAITDARRAVEAVRIARRQAKEREERQEALAALSAEYERALTLLREARDAEARIIQRLRDEDEWFFLAA